MSLPVVLRRRAKTEFDAAIAWYESRQPGLGGEFVAAVEATFTRIPAAPEMYARIYRDARKAAVRRFPYPIYYRIRGGRVIVLSVFHEKRNPNIWKSRV